MRKILKYLVGVSALFLAFSFEAKAANYEVLPYSTVLYSNEDAVLYSDASLTSQVVLDKAAFPDNVPVNVTGITTSGFYQVNLGAIYYIPGFGLINDVASVDNASPVNNRQAEVYNILIGLKSKFPEGMYLTNESFFYAWHGGYYSGGYGCAGFAFYLSDSAFGTAKTTKHTNYNDIKVGDILRINNDTHSVVVLEVKSDSVIVAEGNYNSSVHWGREISKSRIQDAYSYIFTRY